MKSACAIFVGCVLVALAAAPIVLVVYVVQHFVRKYW